MVRWIDCGLIACGVGAAIVVAIALHQIVTT